MEPLSDSRQCWASLWSHDVEEDLKLEAQTLISESQMTPGAGGI